MAIAINSTNFPDDAFRSFIISNIAKGSSTLTDNMRVHQINIDNLGIHDITGIEYLIDADYPVFILDWDNNHIPYYDFDTLSSKFQNTAFAITNSHQYVKFHANEITTNNDTEYSYQFNLKKYMPADKTNIQQIYGNGPNGSLWYPLNDDSYKLENGILKLKVNDVRRFEYQYPYSYVYLVRDPALMGDNHLYVWKDIKKIRKNDSVSLKTSVFKDEDAPHISTTLPVSWSISEGELPPGLTLNPNTSEISGVAL